MEERDLKELEMYDRVKEFGGIESSIQVEGSYLTELFGDVTNFLAILDEAFANQLGEQRTGARGTIDKVEAKTKLIKDLKAISRTSRLIAKDDKGFHKSFQLPEFLADREIIVIARRILADATPHAERFFRYSMKPDFLTQLDADTKAYEETLKQSEGLTSLKLVATATIKDTMKKLKDIVQRIDGIIRNQFGDDIRLMTAWKRARRVEKVAKSAKKSASEPTPEPTPTPDPTPTPEPAPSSAQK